MAAVTQASGKSAHLTDVGQHPRSASAPTVYVHPPEEEDEDTFCCYNPDTDYQDSMLTDIAMLDEFADEEIQDVAPLPRQRRTPTSRPALSVASRSPGQARSVSAPLFDSQADPDIAEVVRVSRRRRDVPPEEETVDFQQQAKPRTLRLRAANVFKSLAPKKTAASAASNAKRPALADASNIPPSSSSLRARVSMSTRRKGLTEVFDAPVLEAPIAPTNISRNRTLRLKTSTMNIGRSAAKLFSPTSSHAAPLSGENGPTSPTTTTPSLTKHQLKSNPHLPLHSAPVPTAASAPAQTIRRKHSRSVSAMSVFHTGSDEPAVPKLKPKRKFSIPELNRYFSASSKADLSATSGSSRSGDESSVGPLTPTDLSRSLTSGDLGPTARLPPTQRPAEGDWDVVGDKSGEMHLDSLHFDPFHMNPEEFRRQMAGL